MTPITDDKSKLNQDQSVNESAAALISADSNNKVYIITYHHHSHVLLSFECMPELSSRSTIFFSFPAMDFLLFYPTSLFSFLIFVVL